MEERNVSRAAERLHITQPAMSKTLTRLRDLFGDALFTRAGRGMQPTPRAEELAEPLDTILGDIGDLLTSTDFDPATFEGEVTLALSEYLGVALLPPLMAALERQAPRLSLRIITRVENQLEELRQGNLDLAIHMEQASYGDEFRVERLGSSPVAVLMRDSHPLATREFGMDDLAVFPIIRLYISDWEQLDIRHDADTLFAMRDFRRSVLEISHLLTALEVLRQTDYIMPAPAYVLHNAHTGDGIVGRSAPAGMDLNIHYALAAHRRTARSPLHNWLWRQIAGTIADLRTPAARKVRQRIAAGSNTATG